MARGSYSNTDEGAPLLIRDSQTASKLFGIGGTSFVASPKNNFLFYVRFFRGTTFNSTTAKSTSVDWSRIVGYFVKSVDKPKISFDVEELNQYNRKRLVQTKVKYSPITIKFHDTIENSVQALFTDYYSFYYGDARATGDTDWSNDIISGELKKPQGYWGYDPKKNNEDTASSGYFFSRIEIYQFYGSKFNRIDIINPKITDYAPDSLDYSDGQSTSEINITFEYEGVVFKETGRSINEPEYSWLPIEAGLDLGQYYEPENYERTTGSFLTQFKNNINDIGSVIFGDNDVLQTPDVRNGFLEVNNNLTPLNSINSSRRGSISSFGNFDFGDNTTNPTYNGNDANRRNAASQSFFGNNTPSTGTTFDPGIFDTGLGVSNSNSGGFLASAFTSEAQRSGNSVSDFITPTINGNSFTNAGYNVVNSTRSPNSQLGFSKGSQSTISKIGSIFFDI